MRLVVQRGHYGRTSGATGAPGEQQLAARIAQRIAELAPAGVAVRLIDADERRERYAGDVFVALHADSSSSPSARGASVGYQTPEGRELAERWKACYLGRGWPGGFRDDNYTANLSRYYGVRIAVATGNRRAVILEHGFLSNPAEKRWMTSAEGVEAAAAAVLEAVTGRRLIDHKPRPATDDDEEPTMDKGDSGPAVQRVQEAVEAWGRSRGRELLRQYGPDGDYGPETAEAIAAYQKAAGLPDTGRVDGITAALVLRYLPTT